MKPYGITIKDYGSTGCCPGHDNPCLKKWAGSYNSHRSKKNARKLTKIQNRSRRRIDKEYMAT